MSCFALSKHVPLVIMKFKQQDFEKAVDFSDQSSIEQHGLTNKLLKRKCLFLCNFKVFPMTELCTLTTAMAIAV